MPDGIELADPDEEFRTSLIANEGSSDARSLPSMVTGFDVCADASDRVGIGTLTA